MIPAVGDSLIDWDLKGKELKDAIYDNFEALGLDGAVFTAGKSGKIPYGRLKKYYRNSALVNGGNNNVSQTDTTISDKYEKFQYFYHPDHLGSSSYITDASGEVYQHFEPTEGSSRTPLKLNKCEQYFPFGETFVEDRADHQRTPYLFNGKELDKETGLYYYGARYYDPRISTFLGVDPMAEPRSWLSPYNFVQNNPINRMDPTGALDDGYQDMQGNYKWFDDETADVIGRDDKLWVKVTDDRNIFDLAAAGILDNVPNPSDPGQITEADNLTSFEMWLDSPSENIGEGIGKIGANIGYSLVNSPYSLLTGKTIGGTSLNPSEKMDAFIDVAPALLSFGLTKTGTVIKTTEKGLQGYNQFLKGAKKSGLEFKGLNWQKDVSKAFQINKVNQQGLKDLDKARNVLNILNTTKKELEK